MTRLAALLLAVSLVSAAQSISRDEEERLLREALGSSAGGAADFIRIVEEHLRKHPDSPRRAQIEAAILRAAVDSKDHERVIRYGWKVFEAGSGDPAVLEELAKALLTRPDTESAGKALKVAQGLEKRIRERRIEGDSPRERARMQEEIDASLARALLLEARALAALGKLEEAVASARRSFETRPSGEAAREAARWSEKAGKIEDAVRALADAFVLTDPPQPDALRAKDRAKMSELFIKLRGAEKGLGDLVLEAYDRGAKRAAEREARLRSIDPNARVSDPLDFTLSALEGEPLRLATLRGKVIVMDFWATWCGPCRTQKPLYDEVKKRFAKRSDVVFLAVNADEDRSRVAPFIEAERWSRNVHFEDGLAGALRISSIPTTVVFGKDGQVFARFNGFVPDRFVEMLAERIEAALQQPSQ